MNRAENGFTLMEMSIVVIIIGFLLGGIVSAQSLVRSTQLQAMLGEYDSYQKAFGEFQYKFLALPGDMKGSPGFTPEDMWGSDPGGCPAASNTLRKIATCNGDSNGTIGDSDTSANLTNTQEWFRAWQQLSNAKFIGTKFTGVAGAGGPQEAVIGQNVPASGITGAGWTLVYYQQLADSLYLWGDQYGHVLTFGAFTAGSFTSTPVLSVSDALAIDLKIDDGLPGKGKVRAWRTSMLPNCTANDTTQAAQHYVPTSSGAQVCSLLFITGF